MENLFFGHLAHFGQNRDFHEFLDFSGSGQKKLRVRLSFYYQGPEVPEGVFQPPHCWGHMYFLSGHTVSSKIGVFRQNPQLKNPKI